jgi:hypothetical protein
MTDKTTIRAITPVMTPNIEIKVITEIKACFRLALRYRIPKKTSNNITAYLIPY